MLLLGFAGHSPSNRGFATSVKTFWIVTRRCKPSGRYPKQLGCSKGEDLMVKHGRGLNREIVGAVNQGVIEEPFSVVQIRELIAQKNWDITEGYITVSLPNGSSITHSSNYKKYFESLGNGQYQILEQFKGVRWR